MQKLFFMVVNSIALTIVGLLVITMYQVWQDSQQVIDCLTYNCITRASSK